MIKIREGYKETEIGIIPEEWEVKSVGECTNKIIGGGTPSRDKSEYYDGDIPWITVKDLDGKFYKSDAREYITTEAVKKSATNLIDKGKVIVATRMGLGRGFINSGPIAINQDMKAIYLKDNVMPDFFLNWYLSKASYIDSIGTGTTVKGIRLEALRSLKLPLPTLQEQKQIAEILSTTDEHIENLNKVIEDYELLKKGMIQKLLTKGIGHTEFKDSEIGRIPKEWKVKRLDECFDFFSGYSASRAELGEEGVLYLHYGDIHLRTRSYIDTNDDSGWMPRYDVEKEKKSASLDNGDIVFADASEDYEGVGKSVVIMKDSEDIVAGLHTLVAKEKSEKFELVFKRYFLNASYVRSQFRKLATGAKVYGISKGNIGQILVCIPTKEEQLLIGNTLSSLEHHIEVLIEEKEEISTLKKELMNRLLTGKVRAI